MANRRFAAGRFALDLGGKVVGFLRSVEGGAISADVIAEPRGKKHIGPPRYEDVLLGLDLSLDKSVYQWLADTFAGKATRHDGAIIAVSSQQKVVSERHFFGALVTEVVIPAADAASKDPGFLAVRLQPELVRSIKGSGAAPKASAAKQKAWLPANFKLEIDGLDCKQVSKIGALELRVQVGRDRIGEERIPTREPTSIETPRLRVTLPQSASQTWTSWFEDFVVKGNNGDEQEKDGKLSFLAPDLKSTLAEVRFFNLGIFRLEPEPQAVDRESIARVTAELYCERIELQVF
jgi:hypothetical protein